jgi:hypothetical protein
MASFSGFHWPGLDCSLGKGKVKGQCVIKSKGAWKTNGPW